MSRKITVVLVFMFAATMISFDAQLSRAVVTAENCRDKIDRSMEFAKSYKAYYLKCTDILSKMKSIDTSKKVREYECQTELAKRLIQVMFDFTGVEYAYYFANTISNCHAYRNNADARCVSIDRNYIVETERWIVSNVKEMIGKYIDDEELVSILDGVISEMASMSQQWRTDHEGDNPCYKSENRLDEKYEKLLNVSRSVSEKMWEMGKRYDPRLVGYSMANYHCVYGLVVYSMCYATSLRMVSIEMAANAYGKIVRNVHFPESGANIKGALSIVELMLGSMDEWAIGLQSGAKETNDRALLKAASEYLPLYMEWRTALAAALAADGYNIPQFTAN